MAGSTEGTGLPIKILPSLEKYDPPEKSDPSKQRLITKCSTDMWGLGCLIWEAFNGPLPQQSALKDLDNVSIIGNGHSFSFICLNVTYELGKKHSIRLSIYCFVHAGKYKYLTLYIKYFS